MPRKYIAKRKFAKIVSNIPKTFVDFKRLKTQRFHCSTVRFKLWRAEEIFENSAIFFETPPPLALSDNDCQSSETLIDSQIQKIKRLFSNNWVQQSPRPTRTTRKWHK